jgi:hypothetical protein
LRTCAYRAALQRSPAADLIRSLRLAVLINRSPDLAGLPIPRAPFNRWCRRRCRLPPVSSAARSSTLTQPHTSYRYISSSRHMSYLQSESLRHWTITDVSLTFSSLQLHCPYSDHAIYTTQFTLLTENPRRGRRNPTPLGITKHSAAGLSMPSSMLSLFSYAGVFPADRRPLLARRHGLSPLESGSCRESHRRHGVSSDSAVSNGSGTVCSPP